MLSKVILCACLICLAHSAAAADKNYDVLSARHLSCPDGALPEFQPYQQSGLMEICRLDHGELLGMERGHVVLQGYKHMGKRAGEWVIRDKSGQVYRREKFDDLPAAQPSQDLPDPKNLRCPDGAEPRFRGWGKSDRMAICQIDHGGFMAAEKGRVVFEGQYHMGKPAGDWIWRDGTGRIVRREHFAEAGAGNGTRLPTE